MAYPGSSGRSMDMIAIDPWHSLEQKCQETMSQVSQCQWGPQVCPGAKAGKLQGGRCTVCGVGLFCKLLAVCLPRIPGWLVLKAAFPCPLSRTAPGRALVSIASPRQVALGSRKEILVLGFYSLYVTSQAAVCNLEQHCKCDCSSLGNEVNCFRCVLHNQILKAESGKSAKSS